jgi:UPF0716 family protein affecting phage T7 exclusion
MDIFFWNCFLFAHYKIEKKESINKKVQDLNTSYTVLLFYVVTQFLSAFNLMAPGFITSNIVFVFLLLILLSFNKYVF